MDLSGIETQEQTRDYSNIFKITNIVVGALSIICAFTQLFKGFQSFFLALYVLAAGAGIIFLEFRLPQELYSYVSFMFSFIGRGVFYLLIGVIVARDHIAIIFPGFIIAFVGIAYIGLQFYDKIPPPANMRSDGFDALAQHDDDVI